MKRTTRSASAAAAAAAEEQFSIGKPVDEDEDDEPEIVDEESEDDGEAGGEEASGEEEEAEEDEGEEELEYHREDGEEDQEDEFDSSDEDDGEDDADSDADATASADGDGGAAARPRRSADTAAAGPSSAAAAATGDEGDGEEESDSEDYAPVNTIGNVPLSWYDEFDHVGYDIDGQKIMRGTKKDELDHLIARFDDPNASRTIHDALHGVDVVLSDDDLKLIRRLQKRRYAHDGVEAYPAPVEFEWKDALHPMSSATPAKAPFLPSKWEAKKVMRLVMAMRSEQYQKAVANRKAQDEKARASYEYLIWDEPPPDAAKARRRLPAPKLALPGNAESYNPPSEYLFTDEERQTWERMDPSDRPLDFVPQRYASLRRVPLYAPLIKERFERCLDLYLCPREARSRLDIDPDSLIPQMPKPAELRPFPERLSIAYKGHEGRVRALSVSPSGQHLLSSAADGTVRLWEVSSGRCLKVFTFGGEVASVAWCPDADADLAAAVVANKLLLFYPASTPGPRAERAREVLEGEAAAAAAAAEGDAEAGGDADADADGAADDDDDDDDDDNGRGGKKKAGAVKWAKCAAALRAAGAVWEVSHAKTASLVVWHHKGDYLASVAPDGASRAVLLHQISRRHSASPFAKSKGRVESVAFHPSKPLFFVATQRHVRVYAAARPPGSPPIPPPPSSFPPPHRRLTPPPHTLQLQPAQARADAEAQPGGEVDLVARRPPGRRQRHRRLVRQEALLVRHRPLHLAVPHAALAPARRSRRRVPPAPPPLRLCLRRHRAPRVPRPRLRRSPHQPAHRPRQGAPRPQGHRPPRHHGVCLPPDAAVGLHRRRRRRRALVHGLERSHILSNLSGTTLTVIRSPLPNPLCLSGGGARCLSGGGARWAGRGGGRGAIAVPCGTTGSDEGAGRAAAPSGATRSGGAGRARKLVALRSSRRAAAIGGGGGAGRFVPRGGPGACRDALSLNARVSAARPPRGGPGSGGAARGGSGGGRCLSRRRWRRRRCW